MVENQWNLGNLQKMNNRTELHEFYGLNEISRKDGLLIDRAVITV